MCRCILVLQVYVPGPLLPPAAESSIQYYARGAAAVDGTVIYTGAAISGAALPAGSGSCMPQLLCGTSPCRLNVQAAP